MNTTKNITAEINEIIKHVELTEHPKALHDFRLETFTKLSTLYRDGKIEEWKQELKKIRRWKMKN